MTSRWSSSPESRISYAELDKAARAMAAAFIEARRGRKGIRVGLIMPNRVQWVQIAVALTRIGAVLVPLSTLLQPPELVAELQGARSCRAGSDHDEEVPRSSLSRRLAGRGEYPRLAALRGGLDA